ncbi:hypothetical protein ACFLT7_00125 [candidate division KSB1 bacterium]
MIRRSAFTLFSALFVLTLLFSACGEQEAPETDPYATLSYDRWVYRFSVTEDDVKISITYSFNFGANKLYTYKETGVSSDTNEEVPAYAVTETGSYEVTETETNKGSIIFTPTGGTAYTVQWAILPPDGNLFITYGSGEEVEFDVQRTANN